MGFPDSRRPRAIVLWWCVFPLAPGCGTQGDLDGFGTTLPPADTGTGTDTGGGEQTSTEAIPTTSASTDGIGEGTTSGAATSTEPTSGDGNGTTGAATGDTAGPATGAGSGSTGGGDGTTSGGGTATSGAGTGVPPGTVDPYLPCTADEDCAAMDAQCRGPTSGAGNACLSPCAGPGDCPAPTGGTAVPDCVDFNPSPGNENLRCVLMCTGGECPPDQSCSGEGRCGP